MTDARTRLREWADTLVRGVNPTTLATAMVCSYCGDQDSAHADDCPRLAAQQVLAHLDALERREDENFDRANESLDRALQAENRLAALEKAGHRKLAAIEYDARRLVEKLKAAQPALDSLAIVGHVHGMPYSGPQYGEELAALAARLDAKE